ncbi:restriction endonuclease subunit S [Candidatus Nanosynbacter sp. BB002]|uniref:restriction endonuclease subunit S n=1 Tax=Candidatus Nanosynbacter sp. BB002 TaxID=3393757 RepID=UPI0030CC8E53
MTKTILLGEVAEIIKGISYRSADYSNSENGIAFVNLKSVARGGGYNADGIKYYAGQIKPSQYVESGDILIANTDLTQNREIIGSPIIMPDIGRSACFSLDLSKIIVTNTEVIDPRYLFYYLKSPITREYMLAHSNGSTVMHLSVKAVPNMELNLPPLDQQKKIANILGSLDEKIELNRHMNETLEQLGQALFRHYFVDKAKQSNGNIQTIPLGKKFHPKRGRSLQVRDMICGDTPVISGGLKPAGFHNKANTVAPVITISASGANAGFVSVWGEPVWSADSSYIDSTITKYVYTYYLFLKNKQKEIYDMQTGSGQPHIYPKHIELLEIANLPDCDFNAFEQRVRPLFDMIHKNKKQIDYLSNIRDLLLPKLISGEIKI